MKKCVIDNCQSKFHGKGMCRKHYMEWWRGHRDAPTYSPPPRPTVADRFWAKVDVRSDDECWIWQASKLPNGYGQFNCTTAHRASYMLTHPNEDITGLHVDHLCRRLDCVNPHHLEAVEPALNHSRGYAVNIMSSLRKEGAANATHCRNGHARTPESVYISPQGFRVCRICKRSNNKKSRQRKPRC